MLRHFEPRRSSLRCARCGAQTSGWTIDVNPAFRRRTMATAAASTCIKTAATIQALATDNERAVTFSRCAATSSPELFKPLSRVSPAARIAKQRCSESSVAPASHRCSSRFVKGSALDSRGVFRPPLQQRKDQHRYARTVAIVIVAGWATGAAAQPTTAAPPTAIALDAAQTVTADARRCCWSVTVTTVLVPPRPTIRTTKRNEEKAPA